MTKQNKTTVTIARINVDVNNKITTSRHSVQRDICFQPFQNSYGTPLWSRGRTAEDRTGPRNRAHGSTARLYANEQFVNSD